MGIAKIHTKTFLREPRITYLTLVPAVESAHYHNGKRTSYGTPGSRTAPELGVQGMFAGWIDEFMKAVYTIWHYLKTLKSWYI